MLPRDIQAPALAITWSPYLASIFNELSDCFDFIEVSYEQLRHGTGVSFPLPVILHCASLSVAGFEFPTDQTIDNIRQIALRTQTPWIGEHLAYISGKSLENSEKIFQSKFTLCPQLSDETVKHVSANWKDLQAKLPVPLILENPPQYYQLPGTNMQMADFISAICGECETGLIIDLAHWCISANNFGLDPLSEAEKLPHDRIIELHLSGSRVSNGIHWDNHAIIAHEQIWDLLEYLIQKSQARVITLEYNWLTDYQADFFTLQIEKIDSLLSLQQKSNSYYEC